MFALLSNIIHPIKLAIKSLKMRKGRTALTILGVVIGITTIIIILSIGTGLKNIIMDQLGTFGSDTIFVEYKIPDMDDMSMGVYMGAGMAMDSIKIKEMEGLDDKSRYPDIDGVYGVQIGEEYAVYNGEEYKAMIWATNSSYIDIDETNIAFGRFFTDEEDRGLAKVAVIGPKVAKKLFGDDNPIGKRVRFSKINWLIVGVAAVFYSESCRRK